MKAYEGLWTLNETTHEKPTDTITASKLGFPPPDNHLSKSLGTLYQLPDCLLDMAKCYFDNVLTCVIAPNIWWIDSVWCHITNTCYHIRDLLYGWDFQGHRCVWWPYHNWYITDKTAVSALNGYILWWWLISKWLITTQMWILSEQLYTIYLFVNQDKRFVASWQLSSFGYILEQWTKHASVS